MAINIYQLTWFVVSTSMFVSASRVTGHHYVVTCWMSIMPRQQQQSGVSSISTASPPIWPSASRASLCLTPTATERASLCFAKSFAVSNRGKFSLGLRRSKAKNLQMRSFPDSHKTCNASRLFNRFIGFEVVKILWWVPFQVRPGLQDLLQNVLSQVHTVISRATPADSEGMATKPPPTRNSRPSCPE